MEDAELFNVDPGTLHLPPSRECGADPVKLQRQIVRYGPSMTGMPALIVFQCSDDELIIYDGVTRATRIAKLRPGQTVMVEVIGKLRYPGGNLPTVKERLP